MGLEWSSKHRVELPDAVALIACFDVDCLSCCRIPIGRKLLAYYIRIYWFGCLPPLIRKDGAFLGLGELEKLSEDDRLAAVGKLPSDYEKYPWQRCKLGCHFWKDDGAACQRHCQISHPGLKLHEVFDRPFICSFRLSRPNGASNVPEGPLTHCFLTFKSAKELKKHKSDEKHFQVKVMKPGHDGEAGAIPIEPSEIGFIPDEADDLDLDDLAVEEESVPSLAVSPIIKAVSNRKKKRSDDDMMEIEPPLRKPPIRRGQTLKATFLGMINDLTTKVDQNRMSAESAVSEISRIISTKAFVGSNSVEDFAKNIRRQVLSSAINAEQKMKLYTELVTAVLSLEW